MSISRFSPYMAYMRRERMTIPNQHELSRRARVDNQQLTVSGYCLQGAPDILPEKEACA